MVAFNLAISRVALGHRVHAMSLVSGQHGPHVHLHQLPKLDFTVDLTLPFRLAFLRIGADVVHGHNSQLLVYATPAAFLAQHLPLVLTQAQCSQIARGWLTSRLNRLSTRGIFDKSAGEYRKRPGMDAPGNQGTAALAPQLALACQCAEPISAESKSGRCTCR